MTIENYTTYTEVDVGGDHVTVTASKCDCNGVQRTEDVYVYKDFTAGHFTTPFTHTMKVTPYTDGENAGIVGHWAVSNVVEDMRYWEVNNSQVAWAWMYDGGDFRRFWLWTADGGVSADAWIPWSNATPYWMKIERADDVLTEKIYSDAGMTALEDTLAILIPAARTYRYVFAMNSYNIGGFNHPASMDVENLDLNEGGGYVPYPFSHGARGGLNALTGGLA